MKLQKQIILWDGLLVLLSGSGVYTFALNIPESKAYDFLLAIFSSSLMTLLIALISYNTEKKKVLYNYYRKLKETFEISSQICSDSTSEECIIWWKEYTKTVEELGLACAEIDFLSPVKNHKRYLQHIYGYYSDFILLTQELFHQLQESKNKCWQSKIRSCLFQCEKKEDGNNVITNQLTEPMIIHKNNVYKICTGEKNTSYRFKISWFKNWDKMKATKQEERCIRALIKCSRETGEVENIIETNEEVLNRLKGKGYIEKYIGLGENKYKVVAKFILYHYFEIKDRMMDMQIDKNEGFKMIVGLMTIVAFFEKQILRIIFWNDIKTYDVLKLRVVFLTLLGILCLYKILKKRSGLFNCLKKIDDNLWYISFVIYLVTDFVLEFYVNKFVWVIVTMIAFLLFILAIYYGLKHKKHDEKTS